MIVLTTPNDNIGSKLLSLLLKSSAQPLRLIVCDPSKLPQNLPSSVEIV